MKTLFFFPPPEPLFLDTKLHLLPLLLKYWTDLLWIWVLKQVPSEWWLLCQTIVRNCSSHRRSSLFFWFRYLLDPSEKWRRRRFSEEESLGLVKKKDGEKRDWERQREIKVESSTTDLLFGRWTSVVQAMRGEHVLE